MLRVILLVTILISQVQTKADGKIIKKEDGIFIQTGELEKEIFLVNQLIKKGDLSSLTIYQDGRLNLISFKTTLNTKKLYSVDSKGFIYDIKPYSGYEISEISPSQYFKFKEIPKKYFSVDKNGFFIEK